MFSLASVYLSIFAYFFFNQKITIFHVIGIAMLVLWAILLVFSKNEESVNSSNYSTSPVIAVILVIISTILLSLKTIFAKYYIEKLKFDSFTYTAASYFIGGLIFTIVSIVNFWIYGESIVFIFECIASGFMNCAGFIFANHATTTGYAGPAAALISIQTIIHTLLSAIFLGQVPNMMQIIALIIGLTGSLSITVGPFLFSKYSKKVIGWFTRK